MNSCNSVRAQEQLVHILVMLDEKPMTRAEICEAMGMTQQGVNIYLSVLRAAPKAIYITTHRPTASLHAPVYAIGNARDAKAPARMTESERYQKRKKEDPEEFDAFLSRKRSLLRLKRKLKQPPRTWMSALMGA